MLAVRQNFGEEYNYWQRLEEYVGAHTEVSFTHSICPACFEREMQNGQKIIENRRGG